MTTPRFDLGELLPGPRFDQWAPRPLRYVALDVDGTTSRGGMHVSDAVRAARAGLRDSGIVVGPATGRGPSHMQEIRDAMGYDGPAINHNGAEIYGEGGQVLKRTSLGEPLTSALLDTATRHNWLVEAYAADHWYVSDIEAFLVELRDFTAMAARPEVLPAHPFDAIKATVVVHGARQVRELRSRLDGFDVTLEPHVVPTEESVLWVNVTRAGIDKGSALRWLFAHTALDAADTLAVGDGLNDVTMLRTAGTAIAMGQAGKAVREHAHFIAPSVFDEGAAAALRFAAQFAPLA